MPAHKLRIDQTDNGFVITRVRFRNERDVVHRFVFEDSGTDQALDKLLLFVAMTYGQDNYYEHSADFKQDVIGLAHLDMFSSRINGEGIE